jgi:coenzyme F420-reducing hydrogenase delta subunit
MVIGCRRDACRYIDGIEKANHRIQLLKRVLDPKFRSRIILTNLNAVEGHKFAEMVNKFYNLLNEVITN